MRIGIVVQTNYPDDRQVRARKISNTFFRAGYRVVVIARNTKEKSITAQNLTYATVYRVGSFNSPFPLNFLWALQILSLARRETLDLIIARNLRIALPAIVAAQTLSVPLVLDLGENWVAIARCLSKQALHHHITRNTKLISILEKICIDLADHVWVVVEENRDRLISLGLDPNKITVVSNTPELRMHTGGKPVTAGKRSVFRMVFVGIISRTRGLDLILRSLPHVLQMDTDVEFWIVGDGEDKPRLERMVRELGIERAVKFTGWVSTDRVFDVLRHCDVGLIPHRVNDLTNTTIPNKLFDYMQARLPVLSTDMKPVKRILDETGCGWIMPDDPRGVAELILKLSKSPQTRKEMGERGMQAVLERYNWDIESEKIWQTVEKLTGSRNHSGCDGLR